MSASLDDIAKIIDVLRSKAEVSKFEDVLSEICAGMADIVTLLERPPPTPPPASPTTVAAPDVTVNVSPTPISVNVSPTPVTVQAGAVNVQAPASWTTMDVDVVRKHGNITGLVITRKS